MTRPEILIVSITMIFSWGIGFVMLGFPGGVYAYFLRKMAKLGLRLAERFGWLRLTWIRTWVWTPKGKITYYEMLQHGAQDPEETIRTYAPWAIPFFRFSAIIWLATTFWATLLFLRDLFGG